MNAVHPAHPIDRNRREVNGYRWIDIGLVIGFLPRNRDRGDAPRQSFQIEVPVG
jgi:hypothetical protein